MRALSLLLLPIAWLACGGEDHGWTPEEIGNAEHLYRALHADLRASEIENLGEPGFDDAKEEEASLEFRGKALRHAGQVRDDVLDKAHPELRAHFRDEFQRAQQLFLDARKEGRPRLETEAIELRNRFGAWWTRHQREVQVPSP